jgi:hypothetical protein
MSSLPMVPLSEQIVVRGQLPDVYLPFIVSLVFRTGIVRARARCFVRDSVATGQIVQDKIQLSQPRLHGKNLVFLPINSSLE